MTKPQQITFEVRLEAGDLRLEETPLGASLPNGKPSGLQPTASSLLFTATAMPPRTDRAKDRDGWRSVEIDGTGYRILLSTGADVEATLKAVVESLLNNRLAPKGLEAGNMSPEENPLGVNLPNDQPSSFQPTASSPTDSEAYK